MTATLRSPGAGARAPQDPDPDREVPFEVRRHDDDHPVLEHWGHNVGRPLAMNLAPPLSGPVKGVDVLSWNLAVGTARLDEVLARLRDGAWGGAGRDSARPLVILAQEAFRGDDSVPIRLTGAFHGGVPFRGDQTQVTEMALRNGLSLRYAPSMRNGALRSDRGNAILSTVALAHAHAFTLPYVKQRRVAVAAELVGLPGLTFVSAHLDTWGRAPGGRGFVWRFGSGRAAQAAALARRIARRDGTGGVIVGADLNTPLGPRDPAVLAMVHEGFTPATKVGSWTHTFNGALRFWLDHVLYHSTASHIAKVEVTRLDDEARDEGRVFGSDHHPLLARVSLAA